VTPTAQGIAYRRHLPHWYPTGATFFVTFGLAGAIPRYLLDTPVDDKARRSGRSAGQEEASKDLGGRALSRWEREWDSGQGPGWLTDPRIAPLVVEALGYRDGKVFDLYAYCVMPSHVHLVCTPCRAADGSTASLATSLQSLKRHIARQANMLLARTGRFWCEESYDHVVRNEEELERIVIYVLNNPVTAGLVADWRAWPWSWARDVDKE
jgi:REP element-mobilizing transposase RayT